MIEPRLTMDELGDAFGNELADALEAGRWLQAAIEETTRDLPAAATGFDAATEARGGFGDRVMAALADEPAPAPVGFLLPLRRRGVGGLWASFRQASVATRGAGRPILSRAAALAYVLVFAVATISLTGAASMGALGLLNPTATESPPATLAPPSPPASLEEAPPSPSVTPEPTIVVPEPTPSGSPEDSEDPEASDDNGGNAGPGGGGDDETESPSAGAG